MLHIAKVLRVLALARSAVRALSSALHTAERMSHVATQRRALRVLDDRQLKDIGLTRADALHEANRPFWDLPVAPAGTVRPRSTGPSRNRRRVARATGLRPRVLPQG